MAGDINIQTLNMILSERLRALFVFCDLFEVCLCVECVCSLRVCMCALEGYTGTVTGLGTSCSLQCYPHPPNHPPSRLSPVRLTPTLLPPCDTPFSLSPLTGQHAAPLCHLSITETAPWGASVTELGSAARCLCLDSGEVSPSLVTPVSPHAFSHTLSCLLLLSALSFSNTDTQIDTHIQTSDCLCQLFPTSASRHKGHHHSSDCHRHRPLSLLASHLYCPGCRRNGLLHQIG